MRAAVRASVFEMGTGVKLAAARPWITRHFRATIVRSESCERTARGDETGPPWTARQSRSEWRLVEDV